MRPAFSRAPALLGAASWLLAGCLDQGPVSPTGGSVPEWPPPTSAAPEEASQATNRTPAPATTADVQDAPPLPTGFPLALPDEPWLERRRLRAHVECTPGCEQPPWTALQPAPVALWTQDLESVAQRFERDARVDVYGLVIRGRAVLMDHGYGTDYDLEPWQAFHAPGAGISLTAGHPTPRLALAVVSDGEAVGVVVDQPAKTWALRPGSIEIADLGATEPLSWASEQVAARLAFERGRASFGLLSTSPRAPMPGHHHEGAWEIIGLLAADGHLRRSSSSASTEGSPAPPVAPQPLRSGEVAAVPPGVHHSWVGSGQEALFAIQLYAPPGPEQRFKTLAGMPAAQSPPPADQR